VQGPFLVARGWGRLGASRAIGLPSARRLTCVTVSKSLTKAFAIAVAQRARVSDFAAANMVPFKALRGVPGAALALLAGIALVRRRPRELALAASAA
jgi:hypothetical protein